MSNQQALEMISPEMSFEELEALLGEDPEEEEWGEEELEELEAFGDAATDQHQVQLTIVGPDGEERLFVTGHLLPAEDEVEEPEDSESIPLPSASLETLRDAVARFLRAANAVTEFHLTSLKLVPGPQTEENHVTLWWREDESGPATESVSLQDFVGGRFTGRNRPEDPDYAEFIREMRMAARALQEAMQTVPEATRWTLELYTFPDGGNDAEPN